MPRLSVDLLCRCTGHAAKRRKDETQQQFLARITHLYCSGKGLEIIENLHLCRSLIALYLYDNKISKIDDINGHTPLLTHLYLQHNRITRMENLNNLHRLTKLYLSYNSISVVEGLEELTQLTELHIASQNLPKGEKLHFDPRTLKTLSNCLIVLNISGNQLDTLDDIAVLAELQQLIANDNKLSSMRDIAKVLSRLLKLWKLDLYNNPIALKQKYRDRIVTMCHRLESLDGREVTELEREFLFSWKAMRKARHQHLIQKAMNFNEKIQVLSQSSTKLTPVHQPHTMPPLPVRQPTRVKLLQEKRKKLLMMKQKPSENTTNENPENAEKLHPDFHLPQITSEKRVLLTGINPQGNSFIPNQSQHVLSLFTQ